MKRHHWSRRDMIQRSSIAFISIPWIGLLRSEQENPDHLFSYCLNTSTIQGQSVGIRKEIEIAAAAGYEGVEIWMRNLSKYLEEGGTTKSIRKLATDAGVRIESSIGFANWIVDDASKRSMALRQAEQEMNLLSEIGCQRMAAPPAGATETTGLDLDQASQRYHDLLELGKKTGITPQLELWGFSANLHKLGEVMYVASQAGHPNACILPDVYHIYKGGSDFDGLRLIDGDALHMFHMNDYPSTPDRSHIDDSYRVYPGDGVAPLDLILNILHQKNSPIVLSLELFNRTYWKDNALAAAQMGLQKMKAVVQSALQK